MAEFLHSGSSTQVWVVSTTWALAININSLSLSSLNCRLKLRRFKSSFALRGLVYWWNLGWQSVFAEMLWLSPCTSLWFFCCCFTPSIYLLAGCCYCNLSFVCRGTHLLLPLAIHYVSSANSCYKAGAALRTLPVVGCFLFLTEEKIWVWQHIPRCRKCRCWKLPSSLCSFGCATAQACIVSELRALGLEKLYQGELILIQDLYGYFEIQISLLPSHVARAPSIDRTPVFQNGTSSSFLFEVSVFTILVSRSQFCLCCWFWKTYVKEQMIQSVWNRKARGPKRRDRASRRVEFPRQATKHSSKKI